VEQTVAWVNGEAPEPEGEVFQFKGTQSPSWVEQHRVHRVLYHREIFTNVCDAAFTRWAWSEEDLACFAVEYKTWSWGKHLKQEVLTIIECLCDLPKIELTPVKPELGLPYLTVLPSPEDLQLCTCWPLPETTGDSSDVPSWGQHNQSTQFQSSAIAHHRLLCGGSTSPRNPLCGVIFETFDSLEFPCGTDGDCIGPA
jgi:hypothetical protein